MEKPKKINIAVVILLFIPLIISYYFMRQETTIWNAPVFHFYYVTLSAFISLGVSIFAFIEYKKSRLTRNFLISLGFLGVAIIYGFHALITPGYTPFAFPDMATHINAFVFFGDASRFWLALLIFIPEFNNTNISSRFASKKVWLLIGALLSIFSLMATLNPGIFPAVKTIDGIDTYFSILFKVITLIILGIVILKFYASYHIKPNFSVLSLIVGNILIFQTVIIFMISRPWSSMWWLAHNLFLLSYITIGIGIAYNYLTEEEFEYFDVMAHAKSYINELKQANKELDYLANYDSLTGLANRGYFLNKLESHIIAAQNSSRNFALLYIDLDSFKAINDTYGHMVGDEVLKAVASRIKNSIKFDDLCARLGGDEFIVMADNVGDKEAELVSNRIQNFLSDPIKVENIHCQIAASIGIALYPNDGLTADDLIGISDKKMYHIKNYQ